jgi:hypothetical protein
MSLGKIVIKTKKQHDKGLEKDVADLVYDLVPTFEVDVEDTGWENADETIKENVEKLDKRITDILENEIKEIDKRLGDNQGNLSDEIKMVKKEIENLKSRKPLDLIVKLDNSKPQDFGKQHFQLPELIQILATKLNVYLKVMYKV